MIKKLGIILVVFLLLCGSAFAAPASPETIDLGWLQFTLGPGMQHYTGGNAPPVPPEGLEELYRWMGTGESPENALFVRMPSGQVLAGISRTAIDTALNAQQLCDLWPTIAEKLAYTTTFIDESASCASLLQWQGRDWAKIQSLAVIDGKKMVSVEVKAYFNCDDGTMLELWVVSPTQSTYTYDDRAASQLAMDQAAAIQWLESIQWP